MSLKKENDVQRIADATTTLKCGATLEIYDFSEGKDERFSFKLTFYDAFVVYGRVQVDRKKKYAFLSYPAYKTKNGDYKNQAFCYDKNVIEEINDFLTDTFFN